MHFKEYLNENIQEKETPSTLGAYILYKVATENLNNDERSLLVKEYIKDLHNIKDEGM